MGKILENLNIVLLIGFVAAVGLIMGFHAETLTAAVFFRWLHVFFGILWIGLLYYFNFVQIPTMPAIPAEMKPAIGKHIAPNALFYFRWAALFTVLTGLTVAWLSGYVHQALALADGFQLIGIGMWLALIMAFNVWFIIWPNQKKALGIVWIGLLYYLNFVQVPTMPAIPAELKGGVTGYIAPKVLFFFRYGALLTVLFGLGIAGHAGYLVPALTFAGEGAVNMIGLGMWLALIMAFNVWFIIWPNQKKALGIVTVTPEEKAKAARLAMLTSRTNTMLSLPMLYCMVAQQNGGL